VVIAFFALFELLPRFRALELDRRWLALGGVLSGFFGGLSGHQGALRAAFLAKAGLGPAVFVGTSVVIAFMVDLARLLVYGTGFLTGKMDTVGAGDGFTLIGAAIAAAFLGVLIGQRLVKKVTMTTIQWVSGTLLFAVAMAIGAGLI
jgi:uncharacterized membrane protein YfcA